MDGRHQPKRGDTKARILDAAEKLFDENGFKDTSINRLAREARVNQAAINYHFGSKGALVDQVLAAGLYASSTATRLVPSNPPGT